MRASRTYENADRSRLRPEYKKVYQACLREFWSMSRKKGWEKKFVLYLSDEPFHSQAPIRQQMRALCDMIHEVDIRAIPIYVSTWAHVPEWDGYLDIWGVGITDRAGDKAGPNRSAGTRIRFTTDGQMCTDTPYCAVERLLPHYCFQYNVEGYEFWSVAWLTYDPYRFGWHDWYIPQSDTPGSRIGSAIQTAMAT